MTKLKQIIRTFNDWDEGWKWLEEEELHGLGVEAEGPMPLEDDVKYKIYISHKGYVQPIGSFFMRNNCQKIEFHLFKLTDDDDDGDN